MNRITETKNLLAMTVIAVAVMFIVPASLANADHEVPFGPLVKSTTCPTEVDVKPTSCGALDINNGAHAVDENGVLIASTAPLTPILVNDPDDTDCDGVANTDDICEGFDDAIDEDSDGIPDGCDAFLNDTDNDGLTNDVDTDDDNDGILDVDETPGCELDPNC